MLKLFIAIFILLVIIVPSKSAYAVASVGIGTGKIEVESPLEPNSSKLLSSIAVYNDGDETGSFQMKVMFNETQEELKPKAEWITFSPEFFDLEAGASQIVEVSVSLPTDAERGEYFAYLEANIVQQSTDGEDLHTSITAAAATKLSFSVYENVKTEVQPASVSVSDPITKLAPILFEDLNEYFIASDKTINNLFSNYSIL